MTKLFESVVGQSQAKRQLQFYADNHNDTGFFPHTVLVGQKGSGKTLLARELQKGLYLRDEKGNVEYSASGKPKRKKLLEINCSSIKNLDRFINGAIIPHIKGQSVLCFLDEASELPRDLTMAFLTLFPTNAKKSSYVHNDFVIDLDFNLQSFIFCTSEPQKVFSPLLNRLEKIALVEYTIPEIATIIQNGCPGIQFANGVLDSVASVCRGNARDSTKLSSNINIFAKNSGIFTMENWKNLMEILGIYPKGLTKTDCSILKYLADNIGGVSLTGLSSRTGLSTQCLRIDVEPYLVKKNLMKIQEKREITVEGMNYLKELAE